MADLALELHSPMTEEEWDIITDVDLDHTPSVIFHTKHGKDVEYVKVVRCKDCKSYHFYNGAFGKGWLCFKTNNKRKADDFCSRGERRVTDVPDKNVGKMDEVKE